MALHPLFKKIHIRNLLSFGPDATEIELQRLNVIIGPNGSGKSNLLHALDVLRSSPTGTLNAFLGKGGGGFSEWIWRGEHADASSGFDNDPRIKVDLPFPGSDDLTYSHEIQWPLNNRNGPDIIYTNHYFSTPPSTGYGVTSVESPQKHRMGDLLDTILPEVKLQHDFNNFPELTDIYRNIRLYREWNTGRGAVVRMPQLADLPRRFLEEDLSNLTVVLNELQKNGHLPTILESMQRLTPHWEGMHFESLANNLMLDIKERCGNMEISIPANRLSDGTLRYLALVTILRHPQPPPLIVLEEPEIGLHPDLLPSLAEMLVDASQRTQLIVTTHSEILVDALTDTPEAVMVCEKDADGSTRLRRLDPDQLGVWLEHYRLGELWQRGDIGGNRW